MDLLGNNNTNSTTASLSVCTNSAGRLTAYIFLFIFVGVVSVIILITLAFVTKRKRLSKNILHGVPGIVVPVNLLTHTPHYIICVFIFGAISSDIYDQLTLRGPEIAINSRNFFLQSLLNTVVNPILIVLWVSFKFFPIFACVDSPVPLMGHVIGFAYSVLCVAFTVYQHVLFFYCNVGYQAQLVLVIFSKLLVYICYLTIIVWYLWRVCKDIVMMVLYGRIESTSRMKVASERCKYYNSYVKKELLIKKSNKNLVRGRFYSKILYPLLKYIFPGLFTARRLPLSFVGVIAVVFMFLYQISFAVVGVLVFGLATIVNVLKQDHVRNNLVIFINSLSRDNTTATRVYDTFLGILVGETVIVTLSPIISLTLCSIILILIIGSTHRTLSKMARGELSFPKSKPYFRLSASWKYAGFQVIYVVTGYSVYTLILMLIGNVLLFGYYFLKLIPSIIPSAVTSILMYLGWFLFVILIQPLLCKFVFAQSGEGKFLAITNRRIFQWLSYTLFFYNALLGLLAAIFRVLISTCINLLLMIRLDRPVAQQLDTGYTAYLGFIHVQHSYDNPVVHMFIRLLVDSITDKKGSLTRRMLARNEPVSSSKTETGKLQTRIEENRLGRVTSLLTRLATSSEHECYKRESSVGKVPRSVQARNRWLVAYTLLRNPSLQSLTASSLKEKESTLQSCTKDECA